MPARYGTQTGSVALSASATKSLILLNPATSKIRLKYFGFSFDGAVPGVPIRWDLYRVTTLGSPVGTTATIIKNDPDEAAADTTGLTNLTTEPTAVEIWDSGFTTPYNGMYYLQFPLGDEFVADAAGNRIGLRVVTPAGVSPNGVASMQWEA